MTGSLGGSQEVKQEQPGYKTAADKQALALAMKVAKQGYVPYMGMDVAYDPSVAPAMQQANEWSQAFGMQPAFDQADMGPAPTMQAGIQGFSSYPGYQAELERLKATYPGLYKYIQSFAIDPVTGKQPKWPAYQKPSGRNTTKKPVNGILGVINGQTRSERR